jgi:hypothetical protein
MYDFDETGVLAVDELTLAFKSSVVGLSKLSVEVRTPAETECEIIAVKVCYGLCVCSIFYPLFFGWWVVVIIVSSIIFHRLFGGLKARS